jgi:hypothetical protein
MMNPGSSHIIECGIEKLYPKIIRIVRSRQTKWESPVFSHVSGQPLFIDCIYIKRRIRQDEVELPGALVQVLVVGIRFTDVSFQSVDSKVHPAKLHRFTGLLLTVDRNLGGCGVNLS